ncbi:MAG: hypothetical protein WA921_09770 [Ahrensia sp.]
MFLIAATGPALAQNTDDALEGLKIPGIANYAPSTRTIPLNNQAIAGELLLDAKLSAEGEPITDGLKWRIYSSEPSLADGTLPLIATAEGGGARFLLEPGDYLVHAAFGRAGATTRIMLTQEPRNATLVLNAGGLLLDATLPNGVEAKTARLSFDIHSIDETTGEQTLVLPGVAANHTVRLPAGTYHVISKYGGYNAEIRADLRVEAGKTTQATIEHRAASVAFELVRQEGGAPLADTAWSILSPTGEIILEHAGPRPSAILASGTYTVVAENRDRVYQKEVTVTAGRDLNIELLTSEN